MQRWLAKRALDRPETRAWALYDWANSAFWLTVITAVFPIYYQEVASAGVDADTATARYTLTTTLRLAVVAMPTRHPYDDRARDAGSDTGLGLHGVVEADEKDTHRIGPAFDQRVGRKRGGQADQTYVRR